MRIVHLGFSHTTKDVRIVYKECAALKKAGHEVYFVTSDSNGKEKFVFQGVKIFTIPNTKNPYRVFQLTSYLKKNREIEKAYRKIIHKLQPDIVHIHEYRLYRVGMQLKKEGYRIVYDMHEDNPGSQYNYMKERYNSFVANVVRKYTEYQETKIIQKADYVITVVPLLYKKVKAKNKKCEIIYNFPILEERKNIIEEKENALCFAGSISKINGIDILIDTINELGCKLFLAGTLEKEMEEYIQKNNNKCLISYLGYLDRKEVQKLYAQSKIGVVIDIPNINNKKALPIKLLEFMNAGLPVITSNFPLRRKIVKESDCGILVNPLDKKEIAEAIKTLLNNRELAEEYGRNGMKAIDTKYNWDHERKKLIQIYRKLEENGKN